MFRLLKKNIPFCFCLLLYISASPQKILTLKPEKIIIPDRTFYIAGIIDERQDTSSIGISAGKEKINFENGTASYLLNYFSKTLPQEYKKQHPIIVKIKRLLVSEENKYSEIASAAISINFYMDFSGSLGKVYEAKSEVNESGIDIATTHEKRIRYVLYDCLKQFAESDWKSVKPVFDEKGKSKFENPPSKVTGKKEENDIELLKPKNMKSIGFLLGGFCLIGYEYEWRVHDYIGINIGAGFPGATVGIKIHTKPHKDSYFFNLSIKDLGFGTMEAVALEWGGRWVFRTGKSLGLIYQFGYNYIVNINPEFKKMVYGDSNVTGGLIFGIGLSW